jgi:sugar lactone lactonase YvrE
LRNFLVFLLVLSLGVAITVRVRYGGGDRYQDPSTAPLLDNAQLERVLQYPEPIGNVAVSSDGRIFFTVHPESRPQGNKLLEWVTGAALPYPSGSVQPHLFNTVLGITIDQQQRLWSIDHGRQGFGKPRLLAFDLRTGQLVHDYKFTKEIAPLGSFLQDIRVSPDGRNVIISDGSILRKNPALVVYDVATKNGGLYRIRMKNVVDALLPKNELDSLVERYSDKPLSDGLSVDLDGNIYVTDVEHNAISIVSNDRQPKTLMRSLDIRWASAVSFGPGGNLYVADSALPELVLETKEHINRQGPFSIFRFKTGHAGTPGQ